MRKTLTPWLLPLLLALASPASGATLTLVYSGNLNGELEPCGCTLETDYGGIRRRATALDHLRTETPDLVAISNGGLLSTEGAIDLVKNRFILSGFAMLGYDAVGVQWRDLALGQEPLAGAALPLVASNWKGGEFAHSRTVTRGAARLEFFAWLDAATSPYRTMQGEHVPVTRDPAAVARAMDAARAAGALVVLGTDLSVDLAARTLPLGKVDVLVVPGRDEQFTEPFLHDGTLVLQPGTRGQRLGRLDLDLGEDGRIASFRHQVIELPDMVPDSPRLADWYAEYTAALRAEYDRRVARQQAESAGETPFVGEAVCKTCHLAAFERMRDSEHGRALQSLAEVSKSLDPNCLECHTVAFLRPGGFMNLDLTANLANVQCESCHGAGRAHVAAAGTVPLGNAGWKPEQMCAQCHNRDHSPSFDYQTYWPKIAHGK